MATIDALLSNVWVIFLIFTFFIPRLQQTMLQNARSSALRNLGKKRGTNVVSLIHRQETLSLFGLPISRYIDIDRDYTIDPWHNAIGFPECATTNGASTHSYHPFRLGHLFID